MGVPLGVLAAHNIVHSTPINYCAKLLLVSSRSVNSLVWALLFAIFGVVVIAELVVTFIRKRII